jgi:flagellar biosynthesis GTPase FlhF
MLRQMSIVYEVEEYQVQENQAQENQAQENQAQEYQAQRYEPIVEEEEETVEESKAEESKAEVKEANVEVTEAKAEEPKEAKEPEPKKKNNVIVPPLHYILAKLDPYNALSQIGYYTNNFQDLPMELAHWIHYDILSRPTTAFGYIPAPPDSKLIKKIIGINGYYLKLTTSKNQVDFIWHNRATNEFQFWGEYQNCIYAMNAIRYRICKIMEEHWAEKALEESFAACRVEAN